MLVRLPMIAQVRKEPTALTTSCNCASETNLASELRSLVMADFSKLFFGYWHLVCTMSLMFHWQPQGMTHHGIDKSLL